MRIRISYTLTMLLLAGCRPTVPPAAAPAGPAPATQPPATEEFIHTPSAFRFPPSVGEFFRETVRYYDPDRLNVSVGYNLGQTAALTVYVYPMEQASNKTLEDHFAEVKNDIVGRNKDAKVVAMEAVKGVIGGQERAGHHAAFTYTAPFAQRMQLVHSELYIFRLNRWFIKCRVTCAVGDQAAVAPALKSFLEQWQWPAVG